MNFVSSSARLFDECEFALELFERHLVPREEIYKHFCIANTLHTAKQWNGFTGIYAIGSQWWCGADGPAGGCNVKCSDLLDDDIEDDVKCASLILSQQGLQGWSRSERACQQAFGKKTEDCLAEVEVMNGLAIAQIQTTSEVVTTVQPTTERTTTTTTTTSARTTTIEVTTNVPARFTQVNTTERPEMVYSPHKKLQPERECSCAAQNTLLVLIALAMCGATALLFLKYRHLKRFVNSSHMEYEDQLIS